MGISRNRFFLCHSLVSQPIGTKLGPPCSSRWRASGHVRHDRLAPAPRPPNALKDARRAPGGRPWIRRRWRDRDATWRAARPVSARRPLKRALGCSLRKWPKNRHLWTTPLGEMASKIDSGSHLRHGPFDAWGVARQNIKINHLAPQL